MRHLVFNCLIIWLIVIEAEQKKLQFIEKYKTFFVIIFQTHYSQQLYRKRFMYNLNLKQVKYIIKVLFMFI